MTQKELCEKCVSFIEANIKEKLSLDDIVNAVYFSKTYIQHAFKKEMGVPIIKYIRSKKMLLAKEMLENGYSPFSVAKELGYENYRQFRTKFKYYYGYSPRDIEKNKDR